MSQAQGPSEWTEFWSQIDAMKREHATTKEMVNRRRGWRFKGCNVFGARVSWTAEFNEALSTPVTVEKPTSKALLEEIARRDQLCPKCFHKLSRCGDKGCTVSVQGYRCDCTHNKKEDSA
jgi:hypothetical protein